MKKKNRSSDLPERLNPGDGEMLRCAPGSIEQQLDMCEQGDLKGDEIQFHHGMDFSDQEGDLNELTDLFELENFNVDMAEEGREGSELSGDEHSMGLQGDRDELAAETVEMNLKKYS